MCIGYLDAPYFGQFVLPHLSHPWVLILPHSQLQHLLRDESEGVCFVRPLKISNKVVELGL